MCLNPLDFGAWIYPELADLIDRALDRLNPLDFGAWIYPETLDEIRTQYPDVLIPLISGRGFIPPIKPPMVAIVRLNPLDFGAWIYPVRLHN